MEVRKEGTMPTDQRARLVALTETDPDQALRASDGDLQRIHYDTSKFDGLYAPGPANTYLVVLNAAQPSTTQTATLAVLVRHHLEAHRPRSAHILGAVFDVCPRCALTAHAA